MLPHLGPFQSGGLDWCSKTLEQQRGDVIRSGFRVKYRIWSDFWILNIKYITLIEHNSRGPHKSCDVWFSESSDMMRVVF